MMILSSAGLKSNLPCDYEVSSENPIHEASRLFMQELTFQPRVKDWGVHEYIFLNSELPRVEEVDWTLVCQLPHNAQVQPRIKLEGPKGKTVSIHSTNRLVKYKQPIQEFSTSGGIQEYEVEGWISGHGIYYSIPSGVKVFEVSYRETGYDTDFVGSFSCNDADYNILWDKATRTCYVCMRDHFMDCPDRERTPRCLGDVALQIEEIFYLFDPKSHELAKEALIANRDYTHIVDQNLVFAGENCTWFYYMNTGDLETLSNQYPHMKKYLETWKMDSDGLNEHKGIPKWSRDQGWDWVDWGSESKDRRMVQCTLYYAALGVLKKIAEITGRESDLSEIEARRESIRNNFDRCFWKGGFYQSEMVDYPDERANAMAVITGLATKEKWESIFEKVLSQKLDPDWIGGSTYNSSSYFERWIMEALCLMGREEEALVRMVERYRDQIESRFTTLYENFGVWWKGAYNPGSSFNHGWNTPNTILSRFIAGLQPTQPGWEEFEVLPKEAFLKHIKVEVSTVKGKVAVKIEKKEGSYTLAVNVPQGSRAVVGIPKKAFIGKAQPEGVLSKETTDYYLYKVGEGRSLVQARGELKKFCAKSPGARMPIERCYDRNEIRVSASHEFSGPCPHTDDIHFKKEGGGAMDAIDGDLYTSWSTGCPQKGDEWFKVDLGGVTSISRLELENSYSPYDYPREFRVLLSDDGKNWGQPVFQGSGSQSITRVAFPTQKARFIRLDQLGKDEKYWWSISDLRIYS